MAHCHVESQWGTLTPLFQCTCRGQSPKQLLGCPGCSAASLGCPQYHTPSTEGASAARTLAVALSLMWASAATSTLLPDTANALTPTLLGEHYCNCLQRSASSQAFQIHLFLPVPHSTALVLQRNISFYGTEITLFLLVEDFIKRMALINTMSFPTKHKWFLCRLSFLLIMHSYLYWPKENQSKEMENQ